MAERPGDGAALVPPYSLEAEQVLLGALLMDNGSWQAAAQHISQPADLYVVAHQWCWQAISDLITRGLPADVLTVHQWLADRGQAEALGGMVHLNALAQGAAYTPSVAAYAKIVAEHALCRRVMALGQRLVAQARESGGQAGGVQGLIDAAVGELMALQQGATVDDEPQHLATLLPAWVDQLDARLRGETDAIPTGLLELDRAMGGGPRRGELVVIGARPSMGKSALMLTIARNMGAQVPTLVCSLEDSDLMLVSRMVASVGRVNLADLRLPDRAPESMWNGVSEGTEVLRQLHVYLDDTPSMGLRDVERKAQQVQRRAGDLGLVVVDYLQLMEGEGESRAYELSNIARGLKRLAKRMNCVVLVLSQLNREADKLNGPPRLDHLAESDGLQQAADIVGLLYRAERRDPKPDNKGLAQVELAKNKNGATDTVRLAFSGAHQRFDNLELAYEA